MKNETLLTTAALSAAATSIAFAAADNQAVNEFIARLRNADDQVRGAAWQNAGPLGAPAVKPLADLIAQPDFELARAAKRALWKIVRHAGRPKANRERFTVQKELLAVLAAAPVVTRREVLWMLSEIGDDDAVVSIEKALGDAEVREDARCSLERIPEKSAVRALRRALKTAPEDFRYAIAHSLRVRGEKVNGYPSKKLVPTRPTEVKLS